MGFVPQTLGLTETGSPSYSSADGSLCDELYDAGLIRAYTECSVAASEATDKQLKKFITDLKTGYKGTFREWKKENRIETASGLLDTVSGWFGKRDTGEYRPSTPPKNKISTGGWIAIGLGVAAAGFLAYKAIKK